MPVSTATPERSFVTMRRVKTYVRSTMRAEKLSGLALLHAYSRSPARRQSRPGVLCQEAASIDIISNFEHL